MLGEEAILEFEAVKSVFGDCVEEPTDGLERAQTFKIDVLPETGGIQVEFED